MICSLIRGQVTTFVTLSLLLCLLSTGAYGGPSTRIITLAPNVTEAVYALGQGGKVVAVSRQCNYPPAVRQKPRVGDMANPSLEAIVTLKPDLVILTDDGNPRHIWERLRTLNIPTYVYRPRRLKDLSGEIRRLGAALGVYRAAEELARGVESHMKRYLAERPGRGKRAFFLLQVEPLIVAGPRTAIDDVMNLLGLKNIASPFGVNYPVLSREEIVSAAPEVIFVGHGGGKGEIMKWKELPAVRTGHVFTVGSAILRLSPRIVEGIDEMAAFVRNLP